MGEIIDIYGETLLIMFAVVAVMALAGILFNQYSHLLNTILTSIFMS